jgi:hypothetical protein
MVSSLAVSRGLYGHYFDCWDMASRHSSSEPRDCCEGTPISGMYERSSTDHIYQVIEAVAPRWTFEGGIRDAARQALVMLCHEEVD